MSKVKDKKVVRRSKCRKTGTTSPASLPPQGPDVVDTGASTDTPAVAPPPPPAKKPFWDVGKDTHMYEMAMKILAMRAAGIDTKEIAATLKIGIQTVWNYSYIAGKQGWLKTFANAKDQIEFAIMPKVVRNLEAALDDNNRHRVSGMKVGTEVALRIADMTIAKRFEETSHDRPPNTVIAIRIETAPGTSMAVRPETIGGVGAYQEGVTDEDSNGQLLAK